MLWQRRRLVGLLCRCGPLVRAPGAALRRRLVRVQRPAAGARAVRAASSSCCSWCWWWCWWCCGGRRAAGVSVGECAGGVLTSRFHRSIFGLVGQCAPPPIARTREKETKQIFMPPLVLAQSSPETIYISVQPTTVSHETHHGLIRVDTLLTRKIILSGSPHHRRCAFSSGGAVNGPFEP